MTLVNFIMFFFQCICMGFKLFLFCCLYFKEMGFIVGILVHFMDQLDYAMGGPHIWSNIVILHASVRVFPEETKI